MEPGTCTYLPAYQIWTFQLDQLRRYKGAQNKKCGCWSPDAP